MASSSSGSHASSSNTFPSFPDFTQDFFIDSIEQANFNLNQDESNNANPPDAQPFEPTVTDATSGGFFDFGGLGFDTSHVDMTPLDPFGLGCGFGENDMGLGLGVDLGSSSLSELYDLGLPSDLEPLPDWTLPQDASTTTYNVPELNDLNDQLHFAINPEESGSSNVQNGTLDAEQDFNQPVMFPQRDPSLRMHTPPEAALEEAAALEKSSTQHTDETSSTSGTRNASSARASIKTKSKAKPKNGRTKTKLKSKLKATSEQEVNVGYPNYPIPMDPSGTGPDPAIVLAMGLDPHASTSNPLRSSRRSSVDRARTRRPVQLTAAQAKRVIEKEAKARAAAAAREQKAQEAEAAKNVWHIITLPEDAQAAQVDVAQATSSTATNATAGPSAATDTSGAVTKRPPGRRKEIFQHVGPPASGKGGRPEWIEIPPWKPPSSPPPPGKPKAHSEMGWVLARIREPDCDRPQYGWAIAEIFDPHDQKYLVLSGPHVKSVKTVRAYDRVAYSAEAIAQLKEECMGSGPTSKKRANGTKGTRGEKVYDSVEIEPGELDKYSSVVGATIRTRGMRL